MIVITRMTSCSVERVRIYVQAIIDAYSRIIKIEHLMTNFMIHCIYTREDSSYVQGVKKEVEIK